MDSKAGWRWFHTLGVAVTLAAMLAAGYWVRDAHLGWFGIMALMIAMLVLIGHGIAGRAAGAWIDERNKMTLSRLQLIAWTIVVLSGFLVVALHNMQFGVENPLNIAVPEVLWLAMGVSTVSLVGSPLVLSTKKQQLPNKPEAERTMRLLSRTPESASGGTSPSDRLVPDTGDDTVLLDKTTNRVRAIGRVEVHETAADASWADLFKGDETGDAAYVDMGKVQMLLLTVVVLLAYGLALYTSLPASGALHALPAIPEGMLALLGISHAGYLSAKAVSHSAPAA
jgi:hypothetical protein